MERRIEFTGTGGGLFVKLLVGMLLTGITFGIYFPWFIVSIEKYLCENLTLKTESGDVKFEFTGTGGGLFVTYLVGALLTGITFGIYYSWFMVKLTKYFSENLKATAPDGANYTLQFNGTGGQLFVTILVGYLLTMLTLGIYGAWFVCKLNKFFVDNMGIIENGSQVGTFSFTGTGGELFVTYLVGMLLTMITFGIYGSWFAVKLMKYFSQHTEGTLKDKNYVGDFVGTGGEFFVINLVGYLLTMITFGIYGAWYMCKQLKFQYENTKILDKA